MPLATPLARYKDLCLDATDAQLLAQFWAGALGLVVSPAGADSNGDYVLTGPTPQHTVWVNRVPEPKTVKNRVHLDVNTESVDRLVELGASVLDADSFGWTVMADPEGGEFCAFVREGRIDRRLYELAFDSGDAGDSGQDSHRIAAWWADLLGATLVDDESGFSYVEDVAGAPYESITFAPVPEPKTVKNRVHLDVTTTDLDALVAAGASVVRPQDDEIAWTVLADPDGNEFCAFVVD
jgi:hypothetical protein